MALLDGGFALLSAPSTQIAHFIPDASIREAGRNDYAITDHPVETGAVVSDHAIQLPPFVEINCVFSGSPHGEDYPNRLLINLLLFQKKRQPIDVYTVRRHYANMLIQSVSHVTDKTTATVLSATIRCRRIMIVSTKTTKTSEASKQSQQSPQKTASTEKTGSQQLKSTGTTGFAGPQQRA